MDRPWLTSLCHLGMLINLQLQKGNHGISFADVYRGLDDGTVFSMVESKIPGFDHWGMFVDPKSKSAQPKRVLSSLRKVAERMRNQERDDGLTDDANGLSLLAAMVLCALQAKLWVDAPEHEDRDPGPFAN